MIKGNKKLSKFTFVQSHSTVVEKILPKSFWWHNILLLFRRGRWPCLLTLKIESWQLRDQGYSGEALVTRVLLLKYPGPGDHGLLLAAGGQGAVHCGHPVTDQGPLEAGGCHWAAQDLGSDDEAIIGGADDHTVWGAWSECWWWSRKEPANNKILSDIHSKRSIAAF